MFGTVIREGYKKDEVELIVNCLDDLCSPNDGIGWSSSGIYCFWNYNTKEILYIGLAIDLMTRFMQHNGLTKVDLAACKKEQIDRYFEYNETIGFSLFVQSAHEQPKLMRDREKLKSFSLSEQQAFQLIGEKSYNNLKMLEGILIESYRVKHGQLPPWNKIGGSINGQKAAVLGNYEIVDLFSSDLPSILVSKYSLRELSQDATALYFEENMHSIRMNMLNMDLTFEQAIKIFCLTHSHIYQRMVHENYFNHL